MERPRRLELPPAAWQAAVLPLNYGRTHPKFSTTRAHSASQTALATRESRRRGQSSAKACLLVESQLAVTVYFTNACATNHRRPLLPHREALGTPPIRVDPGKVLPIVINNHDFPVAMPAPAVAPQSSPRGPVRQPLASLPIAGSHLPSPPGNPLFALFIFFRRFPFHDRRLDCAQRAQSAQVQNR